MSGIHVLVFLVCPGSCLYSFEIHHGAGVGKRNFLPLGARGTFLCKNSQRLLRECDFFSYSKETVPKVVLESDVLSARRMVGILELVKVKELKTFHRATWQTYNVVGNRTQIL